MHQLGPEGHSRGGSSGCRAASFLAPQVTKPVSEVPRPAQVPHEGHVSGAPLSIRVSDPYYLGTPRRHHTAWKWGARPKIRKAQAVTPKGRQGPMGREAVHPVASPGTAERRSPWLHNCGWGQSWCQLGGVSWWRLGALTDTFHPPQGAPATHVQGRGG